MSNATTNTTEFNDLLKRSRELESDVLTAADGSERRIFFQARLNTACALLARLGVDC